MSFGGPGWGAGPIAPSSSSSNTAAGLPFSGIPPEMQDQAQKILDKEPEHDFSDADFTHLKPRERPLNLRSLIAPYRFHSILAVFLVIAETLAAMSGPLLVQLGIDRGVVPKNLTVLIVVSAVFAGSIILGVIAGKARISFTGKFSEEIIYGLRVKVFTHLQRLSLNYYTDNKAGVIMTRMTADIETLTILLQESLINFMVQALTLVVIVAVLLYLNLTLGLITILAALPATLLLSLWFRKASDKGYSLVRDRIADILSHLAESLSGINVIISHNRRRHENIVHRNRAGEYKDANLYASYASARYTGTTEGIGLAVQLLILAIGGAFVIDGSMTIGELTAFGLYLTSLFAPIQAIVQHYTSYQQGQASISKLRELLDQEPSVPEAAGAFEMPLIKGEIELRNVSFSYNPERSSPEEVLHDISFSVAPGECLAIVGETGAGKSTIAKLVDRLYDPTSGEILIDGHNLKEVQLESLHRQIAVVPQEPFLFHDSIRHNLLVANPDASEADIWEAVEAVGISDLVNSLPEGLDTLCHERGSSFSSGERQLLALGRIFLSNPQILILDEATSNIDLKSETHIENALNVLLSGRSSILIAHRLSTALRADRIAVMSNGRIVEMGPHGELLAMGGLYADMFASWQEHSGKQANNEKDNEKDA